MSSLCLSCCSTLSGKSEPQYTTKCCNRHTCDACLAANPRLSQYYPCLSCVGGVQVASGSKSLPLEYTSPRVEQKKQEENAFVIGDDDDEEDNMTKPVADEAAMREGVAQSKQSRQPPRESERALPSTGPATNPKYWIQKQDSLQGIALRLGINARVLCQLNSLPPSTLSTTPHLVHTRNFLLLPPGTHIPGSLNAEAEQREESRQKERAIKRFRSVTRVVDDGVARAYMELAQDELITPRMDFQSKRSEKGSGVRLHWSREEAAVDAYLEDDEWEREQLRTGAVPHIQPFPYLQTRTSAVKA